MNAYKFLSSVLPPSGVFCLTKIKNKKVSQSFYPSVQELTDAVDGVSDGSDLYFGCAAYKDDTSRTKDNVASVKSFWLDLDAGRGKPYKSYTEAVAALGQFCADIGLPKPTAVTSGNGVHAYWLLDEAITREEWEPVAEHFKTITEAKNLHADPSRTADIASILRIPGTFNYKNPQDPKLVVMLFEAVPMSIARFKEILTGTGIEAKPLKLKVKRELDDVTKSLMQNNQASFKTIIEKTLEGKGCAQIDYILQNRSTLEEPMWRAGLSIGQCCNDRDTAIHFISKGHPGYSFDDTEHKADETKGPYTCETFKKLNPSACAGCPHKLTSPIQLGSFVAATEPTGDQLEFEKEVPVIDPVHPESEPTLQLQHVAVPKLPSPYFRGQHGGIYKTAPGPDGEPVDRLVYEHDLYVTKRLTDPELGELVVLELHLPMDGKIEFEMPLTALSTDAAKSALAQRGVAAIDKEMKEIIVYISKVVKELQAKYRADKSRQQFGWCDGNAKFVVGHNEYHSQGKNYNPSSTATKDFIEFMQPTGDYLLWQDAMNMYSRPELVHVAFAAMTGFGSPLMVYTGQEGALINLVSNGSGSGKTTALKAACSVWGKPKAMMTFQHDTINGRIMRMGVFNSLGTYMDEITNISPDDASNLVYTSTMGRGKDRMKSNENALRTNTTRWIGITLTTSNAWIGDKISQVKATSDGENMRMLEIYVPEVVIAGAEDIFERFDTHYGMAGEIYAQWLVGNANRVSKMVTDMREKIKADAKTTPKERFHVSIIACNIVGGLIAKELGIHNIDMGRVYNWAISFLKSNRTNIQQQLMDKGSIIGEFLNSNFRNILKLADNIDPNKPLPTFETPNKVAARWAPDTKKLYISKRELKEFCVPKQIGVQEFIRQMSEKGEYLGEAKKRMLAGTGIQASAIDVYVFACHADTIEAIKDADGD